MRSIAALLALAASALAYQVTEPTNATGWTITGPNVVAWNKVSTDAANFTILLVNQNVNPPTSQQLAALVDGSLGKTTVNPPSGGWKTGSGFQVNLVQDAEHPDTILAQSGQFSITQASASLSSTVTGTSASAGTGTLTVTPSGTSAAGSTAGSTTDALNPTSSDTSTTPTGSNAASASMGKQAGLFAGLALLGAFLA
ncbi:hypothetical protein C8T65DRAFT_628736 [Cerioporus squamosus]|nr:hypothetical protein C8T65DRAFT_628736 [Cerioporus squamosus]